MYIGIYIYRCMTATLRIPHSKKVHIITLSNYSGSGELDKCTTVWIQ